MRRAAAAAALLLVAACDRTPALSSCTDNLAGVWVTPAGQRWMVVDNGATLEVYPLFDDLVAGGAPRVIDLERGEQLAGHIKRRFMQRELTCDARAPIRVTTCNGERLQLVLGEVSSPLAFSPCAWGQAVPARVETWTRD